MSFQISSPAFATGETIPRQHTCEGENRSPALRWSGLPEGALSLALVGEDPDAPFGVFTHWVLYDLSPELSDLPGSQPKTPRLPHIGAQGVNSFRRNGYDGPCPPLGKTHRYFFRLYALDLAPDLPPGLTAEELRRSIHGHVLAEAECMGTYRKG